MYSNWASRSGWLVPSRVLRLACRLKPSRRSSRPTSFWPAAKPRSVSARARWRWLLLTHSKAASGSPRMADCHQLAQSLQQAGLRLHRRLASTAREADAAAEVVPPAAQFGQAAADGAARDTGRRRHCRYAAAACRPRLAGREQAPPPFVQEWRHRLEACSDARDIDHPSSLDTPRSQSHRCPAPSLGLLAHPIPPRIDSVVRAQALTTPSAMTLALGDDTSRHDAGRSLYGRSTARLPTGPASWPTRQGTCPIMVLRARCGRWLLPTSWPAWPAYNPSLPDACRGYRMDAPGRHLRAKVDAPGRHLRAKVVSTDHLRRRPWDRLTRSDWTLRSGFSRRTGQTRPAVWYSASAWCGRRGSHSSPPGLPARWRWRPAPGHITGRVSSASWATPCA